MELPSFIATPDPTIERGDFSVRWHERPENGGCYIVSMGGGVRMYLIPEDAADLVAKVSAAMIARGDLPGTTEGAVEAVKAAAAANAAAAVAVAEARQWAELGQGARAVAR